MSRLDKTIKENAGPVLDEKIVAGRSLRRHGKRPPAYELDERRVARYLADLTGVGGGTDPIGFLILSHMALVDAKRQAAGELADKLKSGLPSLLPPLPVERFWFDDKDVMAEVRDTEYARGRVAHALSTMTCNEKYALYRTITNLVRKQHEATAPEPLAVQESQEKP